MEAAATPASGWGACQICTAGRAGAGRRRHSSRRGGMAVVRLGGHRAHFVRIPSPESYAATVAHVLIAGLQCRIRLPGASRMTLFAKIFTTKTLLQIVF